MDLTGKHRKHGRRPAAGDPVPVPGEQFPTKPDKAWTAAVITLLGLVGIHVTTGTAQALVMLGQLVLVVYGVWRVRNRRKAPPAGGVDRYLS